MDNNFNNQPTYIKNRNKLVDILLAILKSVGFIGIWLGVQMVFIFGFTIVLAILNPYMNSEEVLNMVNSLSMELTFATNIISLAIFILIYKIINKSFLNKIKADLPDKRSILPSCILGVCGQFATLFVLGMIIMFLPKSWIDSFEQTSDIIENANALMSFLVAVILAPIFEEILCRGLILNTLNKVMHKWVAIILSSAIFGIIHGNPIQFIYATALGILLGWIYTKTDSILIPILCHLAFNLTSTLLQYVNTENAIASVILSLVMYASIPIFTLCVVYFCLKSFNKPREEKPKEILPYTPNSEYRIDALEKIQADINSENGDNIWIFTTHYQEK